MLVGSLKFWKFANFFGTQPTTCQIFKTCPYFWYGKSWLATMQDPRQSMWYIVELQSEICDIASRKKPIIHCFRDPETQLHWHWRREDLFHTTFPIRCLKSLTSMFYRFNASNTPVNAFRRLDRHEIGKISIYGDITF